MDAQQVVDFSYSLHNKMNCVANKNNTVEMRLDIMEEIYLMLLTPVGREYTAKNINFRNMLKVKVMEFMNDPRVDPHGHFMATSQELLLVIRNINNL